MRDSFHLAARGESPQPLEEPWYAALGTPFFASVRLVSFSGPAIARHLQRRRVTVREPDRPCRARRERPGELPDRHDGSLGSAGWAAADKIEREQTLLKNLR